MKTEQSEVLLKKRLKENGFDWKNPDLRTGWETFKQICSQKFDCADEGLMFETGVYDFTGEELYYLFLMREFTQEVEGEFDYMEQLHLEFSYPSDEQLQEQEERIHSSEFDEEFEKFFEAVEQSSIFRNLQGKKPIGAEVYFDEV